MKQTASAIFFTAGLIVSAAMCLLYAARIGTDAAKASDPFVLAVWAGIAAIHAVSLAVHIFRSVRAGTKAEQSQ